MHNRFVSLQVIERKGADIMVTRDCLSNLESFRVDVPADKYEGCRTASHDIKLGQHTYNRIKELDTKRWVGDMLRRSLSRSNPYSIGFYFRTYYDNTTWCFCDFDHWCNTGSNLRHASSTVIFISTLFVSCLTILMLWKDKTYLQWAPYGSHDASKDEELYIFHRELVDINIRRINSFSTKWSPE